MCLMEIDDLIQDLHQGPQSVELLNKAIAHFTHGVNITNTDFSQNVDLCIRMTQALTDKGDLTGHYPFYEDAQTFLDIVDALATQRNCHTIGHWPLLARLHEAIDKDSASDSGKPKFSLNRNNGVWSLSVVIFINALPGSGSRIRCSSVWR